jgi:thiol-disulfide isomerase/thioredoxin
MSQAARLKAGRKAGLVLGIAAALLALPPLLKWWNGPPPGRNSMPMHASPGPALTLNFADGQGRPTSLEAFRGRTVLLNVWATWCTPCREEMPTLDRLQAALGGPGFEVLALSIDRGGLPVVQAFYRSLGIRHLKPYLDSEGEASAGLVATGIPLTLLIDAEGREIGRKLGPAERDDAVMEARLRNHIAADPEAIRPAAAASR